MTLLGIFVAGAILIPAVTLAATEAAPAPPSTPPTSAQPITTRPIDTRAPVPEPPVTPVGQWQWPLHPAPRVVRGFELGPTPWSPGHRGVDLTSTPGAAVYAPAGGTVFFAGMLAGRPVLSIKHGDGLISSFEPVTSALHRGDPVQPGTTIGSIAAIPGHCAPATCLHWGVRERGRYIDPLTLLPGRRGPAILLPVS